VTSRSSTLLSRLALALLALAGFVAPAAERELDGVVQTSRATRAAPAEERAGEVQALPAPEAPRCAPASWNPFHGNAERRYLLHRAWLL
jgi:hypothetical protein